MKFYAVALLVCAPLFAAATKEELAAEIARLQAELAAQGSASPAAIREAQNANAGTAQAAVEAAKEAAREQAAAVERLAQAAAEARRSDKAMLESAKTAQLTQWGIIIGGVLAFAGVLYKGYIDNRTHQWEREAAKADVKAVIVSELKTSADARDHEWAVQQTGIVSRIASMTAQYLMTRTKELASIRKALHEGDFDTLAFMAHNLAGTGTSFGYPEVTRLGKLMEAAARGKDELSFADLFEAFANYVHTVPQPDLTTLAPTETPRVLTPSA